MNKPKCTYPCCESDAKYKVENPMEGTAYLCPEHREHIRALGLSGKTYDLEFCDN